MSLQTTVLNDTSRLCIHSISTKPWSVEIAIEQYAKAGVQGITVWRDALQGRSIPAVGRQIKEAGLQVVSLCRGGFFASAEKTKRADALEDNLRAVEEAAELGAPSIVLVPGADPRQSLEDSRSQIEEGIVRTNEAAEAAGVKLSIEPLHPMYADTRSAVNTLKQANDMCEHIGSANVGVAVDVYHLWWDPELQREIARSGEMGRIFAFHVCDWRSPTRDLLHDRGLMGEGCIPVRQIRGWVEEAGFSGFIEVEIFSTYYWTMDQNRYLDMIVDAYKTHT
ncbi:MAG: sugar phosphate isomerase/epimerase family protein [Spirochaetia bacterium]